ncbi:MAG: sulfur oxidation c-type cytochrome SoxX [Gammaproteobacteria bacterium]|nr:sulfur oxidation c-type cytochrome SoxX [Gammaproteobacteria bacterium]
MQKMFKIVVKISFAATWLGVAAFMAPAAFAAGGEAPDSKVCNDKENPPKDVVTQGGCIVIDRTKGNCNACHQVPGIISGDIATRFESMAQRWPDKAKLRAQIFDASKNNPITVMPPFGKNQILTSDEIDKVVEFILSL